jgi:hypothetical protein
MNITQAAKNLDSHLRDIGYTNMTCVGVGDGVIHLYLIKKPKNELNKIMPDATWHGFAVMTHVDGQIKPLYDQHP